MKKLSPIDKLLFVLNSLFATVLLISFLSYFISPETLSFISFLSLSVPFLIIANILFLLYWLLKLKRQFLISALILLIGFPLVNNFFTYGEKKVLLEKDLKIMSYNVRMFNLYNQIDEDGMDQRIFDFINEKDPDVLCVQEFHPSDNISIKYPYKYVKMSELNKDFGHAIFSKYRIINSGSLNFPNSSNNTVYADILKNNDTLRVYNVHLESLRINPKEGNFNQENSERLIKRVDKAFKKQTVQASLIVAHQKQISHKSIICGDFNNNAFSWVYHTLKEDKNDAFEIAGNGFGKTFDYVFPFRIDFILADERMDINNFKTYEVKYSDHFPVMARIDF